MRPRWTGPVLAVVLVLAWGASAVLADQVVVKRNVNLRLDPSTSQPPIRLAKPPDAFKLLEPSRTGG